MAGLGQGRDLAEVRSGLSPARSKACADTVLVRHRVAFIVFLTDLEHAAATKTNQLLSLSDLDIDLPAAERAWSAKTADEWRRHVLFALSPTAPFLSVIRALLNNKNDDPFSESALLIADLGRLSSFPLLILSRTLSYLEKKTEEALEQVDPFKSFRESAPFSAFLSRTR